MLCECGRTRMCLCECVWVNMWAQKCECVSVNMYVSVCMHVSVSCVCECVWAGQRSRSGISLSHSLPYVLEQGLSLNLGLTDWLQWLASEPRGSTCVCLLNTELQTQAATPGFTRVVGSSVPAQRVLSSLSLLSSPSRVVLKRSVWHSLLKLNKYAALYLIQSPLMQV